MKALPLFLLALASTVHAQPVTLETVNRAVTDLERLTQEQMKETGVPGIAIAVVAPVEIQK